MIRTLLMSVLLVVGLSLFAARVAYPILTHSTVVIVNGSSMEPTIPFGSLAYIKADPPYEVGQIVTYVSGSSTITHRLVYDSSGNADRWITKGDNPALSEDPIPVTNDQIVGVVTGYIPVLGMVSNVLTTPVVIIFALFVVLTILLAPSPNIRRRKSKEILQ